MLQYLFAVLCTITFEALLFYIWFKFLRQKSSTKFKPYSQSKDIDDEYLPEILELIQSPLKHTSFDSSWLNLVVNRYFMLLRNSAVYKMRLQRNLLVTLQKSLDKIGVVKFIDIQKIDLGTHSPSIEFIKVLDTDPSPPYSVNLEFTVGYEGGVSVVIVFTLIGGISVPVTIVLLPFKGLVRTRIPSPSNHNRFDLSFVSDPGFEFNSTAAIIMNTNPMFKHFLSNQLTKRLKQLMIDMFVMPSWRSFSLPLVNPRASEETQLARAPSLDAITEETFSQTADRFVEEFNELLVIPESHWRLHRTKKNIVVKRKIYFPPNILYIQKSDFSIEANIQTVFQIISNPQFYAHISDDFVGHKLTKQYSKEVSIREMEFKSLKPFQIFQISKISQNDAIVLFHSIDSDLFMVGFKITQHTDTVSQEGSEGAINSVYCKVCLVSFVTQEHKIELDNHRAAKLRSFIEEFSKLSRTISKTELKSSKGNLSRFKSLIRATGKAVNDKFLKPATRSRTSSASSLESLTDANQDIEIASIKSNSQKEVYVDDFCPDLFINTPILTFNYVDFLGQLDEDNIYPLKYPFGPLEPIKVDALAKVLENIEWKPARPNGKVAISYGETFALGTLIFDGNFYETCHLLKDDRVRYSIFKEDMATTTIKPKFNSTDDLILGWIVKYSFSPPFMAKSRNFTVFSYCKETENEILFVDKSIPSSMDGLIYYIVRVQNTDGIIKVQVALSIDFGLPQNLNEYLQLVLVSKIACFGLTKPSTLSLELIKNNGRKTESVVRDSFNGFFVWEVGCPVPNFGIKFKPRNESESTFIETIAIESSKGRLSMNEGPGELIMQVESANEYKFNFFVEDSGYQEVSQLVKLRSSSKHKCTLNVNRTDSTLSWNFSTFQKDFTFGIIHKPNNQESMVLLPFGKAKSKLGGSLPLGTKTGSFIFVWLNESSFYSRPLEYTVGVNLESSL